MQNFSDINQGIKEMKRVGKKRFIITALKKSEKMGFIHDIIHFHFDVKKEIEQERIPNIVVMNRDLRDITNFGSGSIDHFFMSNVLHGFVYNDEAESVLEVISQVLRKGGILSLIEWDKNNVVHGPPKDHRMSYAEAIEILAPFGLEPMKMVLASSEHILMVFKKR